MKRRVVITGMGTINSLAHNVKDTWESLLKGVSGVSTIKRFDASKFSSQIAAEVKNLNPKDYLDIEIKELKKLDDFTIFSMIAAKQAFEDAGLKEGLYDPYRAGSIFGVGIGGMQTLEEEYQKYLEKGPKRISPFFIPKMISNAAPAQVAIALNLKGPNFNTVSACTSSNHALGMAYRLLQYGDADIILTGGAEAAITPLSVGGFCSLKALSTRNEQPEKASRPFDKDRDGFVIGEGAGALILEDYEHALKRNAKIYAEVIGFGATCDAYHITAPSEDGDGIVQAMNLAIKDASITPEEVDYINAHGTSTFYNDITETKAIKSVFKEKAKKIKISSTKSMLGHSLGAAAVIEAIACLKSIEEGKIHPTINLDKADPKCDLDYVPNKAIEKEVKIAMNSSLGFGGHNSAIIFRKI